MKTTILYRRVPLRFLWMSLIIALVATSAWGQADGPTRAVGRVEIEILSEASGENETVEIYSASYALLIGVSEYENWGRLPGVKNDVRAVNEVLQNQGFLVTQVLDPTAREIRDAYQDFIDQHGHVETNRLLFYYCGHGYTELLPDGRDVGYIVGTDAPRPTDDTLPGFRAAAVSMDQVQTWARTITARHAIFLFDSCFSGSLFRSRSGPPQLPPHIEEKLIQPVRFFITAGGADQEVPDQSVFRVQFAKALDGEADVNRDGYVTGIELGEFLFTTVADYTNRAQVPQYGKLRDPNLDRGDFVFLKTGNVPTIPAEQTARPSAQPTVAPTDTSITTSAAATATTPANYLLYIAIPLVVLVLGIVTFMILMRHKPTPAPAHSAVSPVADPPTAEEDPITEPIDVKSSAPPPAAVPRPAPSPVPATSRDRLYAILTSALKSPPHFKSSVWTEMATPQGPRTRDLGIAKRHEEGTWRIGDGIRICFQTERTGCVSFILLGSSGGVQLICPNTPARPGTVHMLPDPAWGVDAFIQEGPAGKEEILFALASGEPISWLRNGPDEPLRYINSMEQEELVEHMQKGEFGSISICAVFWRVLG